MKQIILASTSPYRKALMQKLGLNFISMKPNYDEESVMAHLVSEKKTPVEVAETLSRGKANSILNSESLIIAGDQLVQFDQSILGKPKNYERATEQLKKLNGRTHELITAVTLKTAEKTLHLNHITRLTMKKLSDLEIEMYLKKDEPYDAAGSYKIEDRGMILFSKIETDDFSAIQGLPLLWVSNQLKGMGYEFFKN